MLKVVLPSANCTVPVAGGAEAGEMTNVTVKVTDWPTTAGLGLMAKLNPGTAFTACDNVGEVDAASFISPL